MKFSEKDKALLNAVEVALFERREINLKNEQGKTYFQPEETDKINPTLHLTREFVRVATGREMVRIPVMAAYAEYFKTSGRYDVKVPHADEIVIRTKTYDDPSCNFFSLTALTKANDRDREHGD